MANINQPLAASLFEQYASPWAFGGSVAGGGTDTTPTVSAVNAAKWFSPSTGAVGIGSAPASTKTPVFGPDGTVIGYDVVNYSWNGSQWVAATTREDVPGAAINSNITVLTNKLLAAGLPASFVEKTKSYFKTLLGDGVSEADAVNYLYYQPTYTSKSGATITSPYATDFGKFNAGLAQAKDPTTLVNWVLGMRDVGTKYNLSPAYTDDTALSKLIKNNVSVANFDARMSKAQLSAITADPSVVAAMQKLGYISQASDLTGFYANPDIAQTEFEKRAKTAAFGAEAVRMQNAFTTFDTSFIQKQAADLAAQGYSEAQISNIAQKGYADIAANIEPATTLAGIYANSTGNIKDVQNQLQQQAFNAVKSVGLQTAANMESAAFQGSAGTSGTSTYLRKTSQQQPGAETPFQY